jgi:NCAIR mutase (PurE)-related protein
MKALKETGRPVLATRLKPEAVALLKEKLPEAEIDELARTAVIRQGIEPLDAGSLLIVCAGTCDLPVAYEAKTTAEVCGCATELLPDVGVAGLHRLLSNKERLEKASVIIAVAGMEGALPSVVAGLVSCPVIAVPTPVGYGASFEGLAALLAMLNSCAQRRYGGQHRQRLRRGLRRRENDALHGEIRGRFKNTASG